MQVYFTRKNFFIVIVVITLSILLFVAYDNLFFRLKSTSPSLDNVATSSVEIKYYFSQPIKSIKSVVFNGTDITNDVIINDKTVTIPFNKSLASDSPYKIDIMSVESSWFGNKISSIEREFTAKYVDFNKLSDAEQKAQVDASNSGQIDDKFIDKNTFPIFNKYWQIDATVIGSDKTAVLNIEFFEEIPDYDNGGSIKQVPNDVADKYRQEVLNEIKKRGGSPDNYIIVYKTNKYLYEKYNQSEGHD